MGSARRGVPPAPPWTPASLANLYFWFKSNDLSTLTFSSGALVSQMNDKSGNGRHMVQANPTNQLLYDTSGAINGHNSLVDNYPGLNSYMTFSGMPLSAPFCIWFIGQPARAGGIGTTVQSPNALGQQSGGFGDLGWGSLSGGGGGPRIVGEASASMSLAPGSHGVPPFSIGPVIRGEFLSTAIAMLWDGTNFSLYQDGVLIATQASGTLGANIIDQIGYGLLTGTPFQYVWNGFWGESFGAYNVSPADFASGSQYIRDEWGTA